MPLITRYLSIYPKIKNQIKKMDINIYGGNNMIAPNATTVVQNICIIINQSHKRNSLAKRRRKILRILKVTHACAR